MVDGSERDGIDKLVQRRFWRQALEEDIKADDTYLRHQCKNIFKLPLTCSITMVEKEIRCPSCWSINVETLPSWAPIGLTEFSPMWEYECQQRKNVFELPITSSRPQEKEIKCPVYKGGYIHRLTSTGGLPMYCG